MASTLIFRLGSGQDGLAIDVANAGSGQKRSTMKAYVSAAFQDAKDGVVEARSSVVAASGTLTAATVVADNTCQIGAVTLTAKAAPANENQFLLNGADNTQQAVNLATVINAHSVLSKLVKATPALAVVTVAMLQGGIIGNAVALAGTAVTLAASGALLAGGSETLVTESLDAV